MSAVVLAAKRPYKSTKLRYAVYSIYEKDFIADGFPNLWLAISFRIVNFWDARASFLVVFRELTWKFTIKFLKCFYPFQIRIAVFRLESSRPDKVD